MKSVMLSIMPRYCVLIANGKKTIEVRKNRPKLETPFKCYIYCTRTSRIGEYTTYATYGKVIGEFVCSCIDRIAHCGTSNKDIRLKIVNDFGYKKIEYEFLQNCQLAYNGLEMYSNGGDIYGWHISKLEIYDEPKELSEFKLSRPPQSWCYVGGDEQ